MSGLSERMGASLRRAPYVWLTATILLFLVMFTPLSALAEDSDHASTPIALVAAGFIAYGAVASIVLVPRFVIARSHPAMSADRAATMTWIFAATPFLFGWCAVAAGGQQLGLALGFVVGVVLLVIAARRVHASAED